MKRIKLKTKFVIGVIIVLGYGQACSIDLGRVGDFLDPVDTPENFGPVLDLSFATPPYTGDLSGEPLLNPEAPGPDSNWDNHYPYLFGFERMNTHKMWDDIWSAWNSDPVGFKVWEVLVAVIDTGVDPTHPDLQGKVDLENGRNFLDPDTISSGCSMPPALDIANGKFPFKDDNGHGTHVAGSIAAALNDVGIVGVAPQVKILPIKALDCDGAGDISAIQNAISYAKAKGANVINLSLGLNIGDVFFLKLQEGLDSKYDMADLVVGDFKAVEAVRTYWEVSNDLNDSIRAAVIGDEQSDPDARNPTVVIASGNEGGDYPRYTIKIYDDPDSNTVSRRFTATGNFFSKRAKYSAPGNSLNAISVGAVDSNHDRCEFSQRGWKIDFVAPGCGLSQGGGSPDLGILSTKSNICRLSGCSQVGDTVLDADGNDMNQTEANRYFRLNGTSMATPHVAGVAGLISSMDPKMSPLLVRQIIRRVSEKGIPNHNGVQSMTETFGFGSVDSSDSNIVSIAQSQKLGVRFRAPSLGTGPGNLQFSVVTRDPSYSYRWEIYILTGSDIPPDNSTEKLDLASLSSPALSGVGQGTLIQLATPALDLSVVERRLFVVKVQRISGGVPVSSEEPVYDIREFTPDDGGDKRDQYLEFVDAFLDCLHNDVGCN